MILGKELYYIHGCASFSTPFLDCRVITNFSSILAFVAACVQIDFLKWCGFHHADCFILIFWSMSLTWMEVACFSEGTELPVSLPRLKNFRNRGLVFQSLVLGAQGSNRLLQNSWQTSTMKLTNAKICCRPGYFIETATGCCSPQTNPVTSSPNHPRPLLPKDLIVFLRLTFSSGGLHFHLLGISNEVLQHHHHLSCHSKWCLLTWPSNPTRRAHGPRDTDDWCFFVWLQAVKIC